ncbi:hypothetical protein GCM10027215_30860 [Nocardioides zeae]
MADDDGIEIVAVASDTALGAEVTILVPHWEQNRASSGFCLPQAVQNGMVMAS